MVKTTYFYRYCSFSTASPKNGARYGRGSGRLKKSWCRSATVGTSKKSIARLGRC